jgi:hypothetical protein
VKLASASADGGPNIDMIAFDIKGVYRTGCSPAKVKNDNPTDTSTTRVVPVRAVTVQPAVKKTYNALGRVVPGTNSHSKLPKGRYFER